MRANVNLFDLYKTNKNFKTYVDNYAKQHNKLFPEDCFYDPTVMIRAERIKENEGK